MAIYEIHEVIKSTRKYYFEFCISHFYQIDLILLIVDLILLIVLLLFNRSTLVDCPEVECNRCLPRKVYIYTLHLWSTEHIPNRSIKRYSRICNFLRLQDMVQPG